MKNIEAQDPSSINAFPTKELFISMLVRDITLKDAIGDLLDNSVDGALRLRPEDNYDGLEVSIELNESEEYFKIVDNCGGIPVSVARDYAFRFGRSKDADKTGHSVGVFGIGMKRALFRLGQWFSVTSIAGNSSFTMEVDVNDWKKDDENSNERGDWHFKFIEYKENLDQVYPDNERGTTITIKKLHPEVLEAFKITKEVDALIEELQREHLYSIDKGLSITVNGKPLEAPELKLLASDELKPAYWEDQSGPVKVKIFAGVSEQEKYGQNGGWYIFCNKRLVLGPDQTKTTGWGVKSPIRIPDYHPQFYRFRGYAFLDAEDPQNLPWNTAKTNMDLDSPVYRAVLQQMIILMRSVIDFLNQLHTEEQDFRSEKIFEAPLQTAVEKAPLLPLNTVSTSRTFALEERFIAPKPAEPENSQPSQVWIRYSISQKEYDLVKDYFEIDKPGEIGRMLFDYFFEREIKE